MRFQSASPRDACSWSGDQPGWLDRANVHAIDLCLRMIICKVYGPDTSTSTEIQNAVDVFPVERRFVQLSTLKHESDLVVDIKPVIPSVDMAPENCVERPPTDPALPFTLVSMLRSCGIRGCHSQSPHPPA